MEFIIYNKTQRKRQVDIGFQLSVWVYLPQYLIKQLYNGYTISRDNLTISRNSTGLTNLIITRTGHVLHNKTQTIPIKSQQISNSSFIATFVIQGEHHDNECNHTCKDR